MTRYYCQISEYFAKYLGLEHEYVTFTEDCENPTVQMSFYRFLSYCENVIELEDQKYRWLKCRDSYFDLNEQDKLMFFILSCSEVNYN